MFKLISWLHFDETDSFAIKLTSYLAKLKSSTISIKKYQ